jgi:uroporphyrinogen-III synthase
VTTPPIVLVTRPRPEAEETAARVERLGYPCLLEPMLEIVPLAGPPLDLGGVQAILVTSRNGARALAYRTTERGSPVFAVGEATAQSLRALGFRDVTAAGGTAAELTDRVRRGCDPGKGALLHVRGDAVATDPVPLLRGAGLEARSAVLYEARTPSAFSPHLERTMRQRAIGYALFFSPRTARTFVTLANAADLSTACGEIEACCLSAAVAAALDGVRWRAVRVSVRPEQDALLALLASSGERTGSRGAHGQ